MNEQTIELLMHFGLTRQEAKSYGILLSEGSLTGYEVAKRLGISRSNAYGALAGLVEKGAAYVAEEQAVQYLAVPIEEFCANKMHFYEKIATELKNCIPKNTHRSESYLTIRGRAHIEDKFRNMLNAVEERVYLSVPVEILDLFRQELETLVRKEKKVVILTEHEYSLKGAIIYITNRSDTQIRMIADSKYALTGELSDEKYTACLYSGNPNLVKLLKEALANEIKLIQMEMNQ